MGLPLSKLWNHLFGNKEARMSILGLDGAGKSTLLYQLHLGEVVSTMPTIGFNVETVVYNKTNFTMWDLGGQAKIRSLWKFYLENLDGLIFVVDSVDTERLGDPDSKDGEEDESLTARGELKRLVRDDHLRGVPILVYANKQDQKQALSVEKVAQRLSLSTLFKNRHWKIQGCSGLTGAGLHEGLHWLSEEVHRKK